MSIIFFRNILLYLLIIFAVRLMGKRQIGELQPSELVVTILISNLASMPIEHVAVPLLVGVLPVLMLVCLEVVMSALSLKSNGVRRLVSGRPIPVVYQGEILQDNLRTLRFSVDDLMEELRIQGIFDPHDVWMAIVETNGKLSVCQRFAAQNTTARMMGIHGAEEDPVFVAVSDGKLNQETLSLYGKREKVVTDILEKEKVSLQEVLLLSMDQNNRYHLVRKEGQSL